MKEFGPPGGFVAAPPPPPLDLSMKIAHSVTGMPCLTIIASNVSTYQSNLLVSFAPAHQSLNSPNLTNREQIRLCNISLKNPPCKQNVLESRSYSRRLPLEDRQYRHSPNGIIT